MLLELLSSDFGAVGEFPDIFNLFNSQTRYGDRNLMFTDETKMLLDVSKVDSGSRDTYFTWVGKWTQLLVTNILLYYIERYKYYGLEPTLIIKLIPILSGKWELNEFFNVGSMTWVTILCTNYKNRIWDMV